MGCPYQGPGLANYVLGAAAWIHISDDAPKRMPDAAARNCHSFSSKCPLRLGSNSPTESNTRLRTATVPCREHHGDSGKRLWLGGHWLEHTGQQVDGSSERRYLVGTVLVG